MELNPSLIEITGEDDSLLHEIPTLDDPTTAATATNYYFTCSPLQIPGPSRNADRTRVSPIKGLNDNMDVEKPTCSSVVGSSNKENINVDKSVAPKPCVEPQQIKRRKRGGTYNLRKSLAWDRAFFTEEGVLNPLELSILSGNFGSCCRETLPTIHEEGRKFYSNSGGTSDLSNLQLHGEKLVKEILVPSSSKRENTSSLLMNHVSPARDNLAPTSMGTPKMLSNHKGSRTWSKSGGCPRPLGFPSLKRPATASTTKSAMKGSKLSKIPVSRSGAHSLPKSNKSNVLSSSHSEHNQIGQADIFQKIAGLQGSIKNSKSSPSKSKARSDSLSMTAKSSVQHSRRNIANLALEVHSSTNPQPTLVTKANCGLEMFAAAVCPPVGPPVPDAHDLSTTTGSLLSHDTHFINGNMQCKQLQTIRPSGLRMPSPSLGFFVQPKSSSSNSSSLKAAQPSNIPGSSIPSLQRHKALNSTINPRWRLHAPAKMQKMDNNPTVSGNSMVSGSSTECSVPCVGNDASHENGKLKLEGNNLLIVEELIPCYSKRSEPRENQEVDSIVAGDEVFQECGEPHKIYRSSKDDSDSNNEVNIVCPDYRDPSRNDLENTDKTEQINASGEGYQICQRKNHNRTSNDGILLEERKLFECQKYESENVANVNSNGCCSEGSEKLSLNSSSKITEHAYKCAAGVDQLSGNLHVEDLEVLFLDKTSLAKSCDNKLHTSEMYDQILVVDDDNVTSGEPPKPQSRCLLVEQSSQFLSDDDYSSLSKSTCAEESHGDLGAIQAGDADVYEMVDQQQVKVSLSSSAEGVSPVEIHNCYVDTHFGRDLSMKKSGDHMDDDLNTCKSMAFCSLSKEDEMGANGLKNDILAEKAETKVSSDSPHEVNERIKINCGILVGESISFDEFDTGDLGNTADVGLINQGSIGIESKSRKIASLFEYHKSSIDTDFGNDTVFSGQTSFTKSDLALVLSDNQNFGVITNCKANCLDEESSFPVQKGQILANETNVVHLGVDNINTILPDDPEISISQTDISPTGELQHKLDNGISLVEDDDTTVPVKKGEDGGKQNNLTVRPPINAVPFSDEWLAAMEAAGEEILTIKSGAVQNSPTDKSLTEPGPWSPVKRKQNQIGPFDCTKFNIPPPDSI